jgi:predicted nucleic acid-binding Zn ribbon protein
MKRQQFKTLGDSVQEVLHEYGIEKMVKQHQVIGLWPQLVGENVAQVAKPARVVEQTLYVKVKGMAWRTELQFQKHSILEQIEKKIGPGIIEDIRFF